MMATADAMIEHEFTVLECARIDRLDSDYQALARQVHSLASIGRLNGDAARRLQQRESEIVNELNRIKPGLRPCVEGGTPRPWRGQR
jgi:hypothetical protein